MTQHNNIAGPVVITSVFGAVGAVAAVAITKDVQTSLITSALTAAIPATYHFAGKASDKIYTDSQIEEGKTPDLATRDTYHNYVGGAAALIGPTSLAIGAVTNTMADVAGGIALGGYIMAGIFAGAAASLKGLEYFNEKTGKDISVTAKSCAIVAGSYTHLGILAGGYYASQASDASVLSILSGSAAGAGVVLGTTGAVALAFSGIKKASEITKSFIEQRFDHNL